MGNPRHGCVHTTSRPRRSDPSKRPHHDEQQSASSGRVSPGTDGERPPPGKTPPGTTPGERPSLDASVALFLALPCRAEESLRRISAGCFAVREGEEIARASDRTCGDDELSSAQCAQPSGLWYRFFGCGAPLCRLKIVTVSRYNFEEKALTPSGLSTNGST